MRHWAVLLGGLMVWAAHFFAVYVVASVFPGSDTARGLAAAATAAGLTADAAILWFALRPTGGSLERWIGQLGAIGATLSFVAVLWQGLPAILV